MTGGSAAVDLTHCIGCGLCVTTCTTGAMQLVANPERSRPPASTPALYMKMYAGRFGAYKTAKAIGAAILGRQP